MSKRTVVSKKQSWAYQNGNLTIIPSIDNMLEDTLKIMNNEIARLTCKSNQGRSLDANETRILQGYVKSLVEISKELRENSKKDDFTKMSNEEIVNLLTQLVPENELQKLLTKLLKEPKNAK